MRASLSGLVFLFLFPFFLLLVCFPLLLAGSDIGRLVLRCPLSTRGRWSHRPSLFFQRIHACPYDDQCGRSAMRSVVFVNYPAISCGVLPFSVNYVGIICRYFSSSIMSDTIRQTGSSHAPRFLPASAYAWRIFYSFLEASYVSTVFV